jgi:hypothetical protein
LVAFGLGLRILAAGPGTPDTTPVSASVGAIGKLVDCREPESSPKAMLDRTAFVRAWIEKEYGEL